MSELPFDQLITALGNWSRGIPDIRAREPEALVTRVIDAMTAATQRAEAAEAERENVSSQLWDCMNEREALRAERNVLRKALEVVRPFVRVIREARKADVLGEIHGERVRVYVGCLLTPSLAHSDDVIAALAVQPTTGDKHE